MHESADLEELKRRALVERSLRRDARVVERDSDRTPQRKERKTRDTGRG